MFKHSYSKKQLANVRVIQRNLVYVVGLTLNVAKEEVPLKTRKILMHNSF